MNTAHRRHERPANSTYEHLSYTKHDHTPHRTHHTTWHTRTSSWDESRLTSRKNVWNSRLCVLIADWWTFSTQHPWAFRTQHVWTSSTEQHPECSTDQQTIRQHNTSISAHYSHNTRVIHTAHTKHVTNVPHTYPFPHREAGVWGCWQQSLFCSLLLSQYSVSIQRWPLCPQRWSFGIFHHIATN